ncbi:riboflavin synthase subunit alpha [Planctomycetia bacterium]|nr:riboflavin synthase subunit alpha [Planctomycetia bacterium]
MFTGLIESLGTVQSLADEGDAKRVVVEVPASFLENALPSKRLGDSIAINGCCLTVVAADGVLWSFQAGHETLAKTNLGRLRAGDSVNLERAMPADGRFGGHIVQGHVDGVGRVSAIDSRTDFADYTFEVPAALAAQMVEKGSVAVDGISLTLVRVTATSFQIMLIPHTLAVTTLGQRKVGDEVNIETDVLAKYVAKLLAFATPSGASQ